MRAASTHRPATIPAGRTRSARRERSARGEQRDVGVRIGKILLRTARAFAADNITRLGAALAFYTTIAVAPLLVLAVAVAGIFFDEDAARQQVLGEIAHLAGAQAGTMLATIQNPAATTTGTMATVIGVGTLIFGALGVFQHLQDALNAIWRVRAKPVHGWQDFVRYRVFSFATVLVTGFLLLVSLIASSLLSWIGARAVQHFGLPVVYWQIADNGLSFAVVTLLFALIFKLLPDTPVQWRHVWLGAAVTSLLFTAGKSLLGFYLGRAAVTSAYGAAGSLVALLLWCYYAAQIVFLGAEFTRVASKSLGGRDFSALEEKEEKTRGL